MDGLPSSPTQEEVVAADTLMREWGAMYAQRKGRPYSGGKYASVDAWIPFARHVLKLRADPVEYVRAVWHGSTSTPFVSSSFGPHADRKWRMCYGTTVPEGSGLTATAGNVLKRICSLKYLLLSTGYPDDMRDDRTREFVLSRLPGVIDPLAAVILAPDDDVWETYGNAAAREVLSDSLILPAIKSLDLGLAAAYIEEHLCNNA